MGGEYVESARVTTMLVWGPGKVWLRLVHGVSIWVVHVVHVLYGERSRWSVCV